ncbi:MAG: flavin monoamine oxidase family protein [Rhizobiaceae bacterium]
MSLNSKPDIIIVGAGLSGLCCAALIHEGGKKVLLLEAGEITGGRILSVMEQHTGKFVADLGPSWIWPDHQSIIARWLAKLGLKTLPQYSDGKAILDYGPDQPVQTGFIPTQDGNEYVRGGSRALIDKLVDRLPAETIMTGTQVKTIDTTGNGISVLTKNPTFPVLEAEQVIVALPARIAATCIDWQPGLPGGLSDGLLSTPTWMAPHAKVAIIYDQAFWREQGLSGRIASRAGPIVECHDHCGQEGSPAALWGFIGWPPHVRAELGETLKEHIRTQLKRCFGEQNPDPMAIHVEDWATNPFVTTPQDLIDPINHPDVGPDVLRNFYFDNRICFAGSETAERSPGLIEGAFDAAERAVHTIQHHNSR